VGRARACGLDRDTDARQLTDELLAAVIPGVRPSRPDGKSKAWETIAAQHEQIKAWLAADLTLTKVHTLLGRRGVMVSYRTLHRYATTELGFGQRKTTVRVADCEPSAELQVDFGRLGSHRHRRRSTSCGAGVDLHRGVFATHVRLADVSADAQ
jgi:hypothetical protein